MDYINKMSYNDKEESFLHLLVWVNRERSLIGQSNMMHSLIELRQSRLLPSLLQSINVSYFFEVADKQFDYKSYLLEIERYLMEMQDLRVKRSYRQHLLKIEDMSELVKLVLFLIMKQDAKQEYISRILELQEETQVYLMNELKKLQGYIENNVQIKEIHQKIEELESENEYLSDKLKGLEQQTTTIANMEAALREDNEHFKVQNCKNKREKTEVLEAIGVDHLSKDYLTIYRDVQLQQKQAIATYKQIEGSVNQLQENNREISDKIEENTLIIGHLDDELVSFSNLYQQVKADAYHHQKSMGKENLPKKSSVLHKPCKSQFDDEHTTTSFSANVLDDIDQPLEDIIKNYSGGLVGKLESLYAQIANLQRDISGLKDNNSRLVTQNRKKERLIALVERQFQCFVVNYQFTIRG